MAKGAKQKLKLLRLAQLFYEKTSVRHMLTRKEIRKLMLNTWGIEVNERVLLDDIDALIDAGLKIGIDKATGKSNRYYLKEHVLSCEEGRYIIDVLLASNFLPKEMADSLIHKIMLIVGKACTEDIRRCLFFNGKSKPVNQEIFESISAINSAIINNHRVSFRYLRWNDEAELVEKTPGLIYDVSPLAMVCEDARYYLVGFDNTSDKVKHFRIDKICKCKEMTLHRRINKNLIDESGAAEYANHMFRMYCDDNPAVVTLSVHKNNIGLLIDRFGRNIRILKDYKDVDRRVIHISLQVGSQFYGWLLSQGNMVRLEGPQRVIDDMKSVITDFYSEYV